MKGMHTYRDTAIVLRCHDLGEADRIITLLTAQYGLVRMVAKGVRRTRSKFGARLEIGNTIDVMLVPARKNHGLGIITSVSSVHSPGGVLASHYGKYTASCVIIDIAGSVAGVECAPFEKLVTLTSRALDAIAVNSRAYRLIIIAYLLRSMAYAGWLPALDYCAVCAEKGTHYAFDTAAGGVVCRACHTCDTVAIEPVVLQLLQAAYMGRWEDVSQDLITHKRGLSMMVEYFRWHIGVNISSLATFLLYDSDDYYSKVIDRLTLPAAIPTDVIAHTADITVCC